MRALDTTGPIAACALRATVLIVDHDVSNMNVLGALLRAHYDVLVAPSGERALQIASSPPELILLDVVMPGLGGDDVLARLRDTRDIPVIFVTGPDSTEDEEKGLELGAADYTAKIFHEAAMKQTPLFMPSPYLNLEAAGSQL